jgi:hypothetical protein
MIRVRNDDVLRESGDWVNREVERLTRVHAWISEFPDDFLHVPTIVVNDIVKFPEAIEFVQEETKKGLMVPEVHGLEHIDYCSMTRPVIIDHLSQCLEWFDKTGLPTPTRFYTPWGGWNQKTADAAATLGLETIGVDKNWTLEAVCARLGAGELVEDIHGNEVFFHWWNRGIRLKRLAMAVKHGSWAAAKVAEDSKEFF